MLNSKRRRKPEIYADILEAIILCRDGSKEETVRTHVFRASRLDYNYFNRYIGEMKEEDLLNDDSGLAITIKGRKYMLEFQRKKRNFSNKI